MTVVPSSQPARPWFATIAGDLARAVLPLAPDTRGDDCRDRFIADEALLVLPVVDAEGQVVGVLNRFRFLEGFTSRFGRELVARRPVRDVAEPALQFDEQTSIDDVGLLLANEDSQHLFDGFVVTKGGRYLGVGTGLDVFRAATALRHAELHHRASHDPLTGLPNRDLFESRLSQAVLRADGRNAAVILLDLDRFKELNDTFGHRFGDLVLCTVASRLQAGLRRDDLVARLSGDEFAVVLGGLHSAEEAATIAQVLVASCSAPLRLEGHAVALSCSAGIAVCPDHGTTPDRLSRAADAALYGAKEIRNHWQMYSSDLLDVRAPLQSSALRLALERGDLEVHYQPIVSLESGAIEAVEALVRWTHPATGPIPASQIVALAEDSGLIVDLGTYVTAIAVAQMQAWDAEVGATHLRLSVNVSALQVREGSLVSWLDQLMASTGFDPTRLELEFTETGSLRQASDVDRCFHDLSTRGFALTIDDFGTGYSALSRLERLPIGTVKIDRSFVHGIGTPRRGGTIAQAIAAMGRSLGLRVIGEGVETPQQRDFLAAAGCHAAQGYLLGRPQPAADLTPRLLPRAPI